jgi:DNA-binding transcriptional ArsR family regulator
MKKNTCIRVYADQRQISNCRKKLQENAVAFAQLSKVLALAGNEVRLKILYLLEEEQELCPCDLSDMLGMTIPAVSQHLRKLKDGSIVDSKRIGQTIFYFLKREHLNVLNPFFHYVDIKSKKNSRPVMS